MTTRLLLLFFAILLIGCSSPIGRGVQKTLHVATLGLIQDPSVSDEAKQDVINHQADNAAALALEEMIRATYKDYHRVALVTYIVGVAIVVMSFINIPALSFLTKQSWKVGAGIVGGAALLSLYATMAVESKTMEHLLYGVKGAIGLFLAGCAYVVYKIVMNIRARKKAREQFGYANE